MPEFTYNLVLEQVKDFPNPKITVLGLTYKPDIDDIRESPAIEIVKMLESNSNLRVSLCDPHVKGFGDKLLDLKSALKDSDCILMVVNHKEFDAINPADIAHLVNNKIIIDTRNSLNSQAWEASGFKYILLGDGKGGFVVNPTVNF
jgi:UDP-N-acetyl-D-mannosaminuronic acid dehydrogenase